MAVYWYTYLRHLCFFSYVFIIYIRFDIYSRLYSYYHRLDVELVDYVYKKRKPQWRSAYEHRMSKEAD
jgi:hypothetical protein